MSYPITEEQLTKALKTHSIDIKEGMREEMRANTREIIQHFNESQGLQNERLGKMDGQLERIEERLDGVSDDVAKIKLAVIDLLATDRHLHNLVRELQRNGIAIAHENVFTTSKS